MRGNTGRRIRRLVAAASITVGAALLVGGFANTSATPNDATWTSTGAKWLHSTPASPQTMRVEADATWTSAVPLGTSGAN